MWSNKPSPNPNNSEEEEDNKDEWKIMRIQFIFAIGFNRRRTIGLPVSRRQLLISEEKGLSVVLKLLSQIDEDDDLPKWLLEHPKLVNYVYNCLLHLRPKELDLEKLMTTVDVQFQYCRSDEEILIIGRWITEGTVNKDLDDIKEDQQICCAICLEDLQFGDEATYLTCKHVFHPNCIHFWAFNKASGSCPICRFPFSGFFDLLSFKLAHDGGLQSLDCSSEDD